MGSLLEAEMEGLGSKRKNKLVRCGYLYVRGQIRPWF